MTLQLLIDFIHAILPPPPAGAIVFRSRAGW